jgi:Acyl-CoA carboxylase epsilon subunit
MIEDRDQGSRPAPVLRVVHGSPSPEEIAALVAVLAAQAPAQGAASGRRILRNGWSERSRLLRAPLLRGPGGWRASGLPR